MTRTKHVDILSKDYGRAVATPEQSLQDGESLSFNLGIGTPLRNLGGSHLGQGMPPSQLANQAERKGAYAHTEVDECPECQKKMVVAYIDSEQVFYCEKHRVAFPKRL